MNTTQVKELAIANLNTTDVPLIEERAVMNQVKSVSVALTQIGGNNMTLKQCEIRIVRYVEHITWRMWRNSDHKSKALSPPEHFNNNRMTFAGYNLQQSKAIF